MKNVINEYLNSIKMNNNGKYEYPVVEETIVSGVKISTSDIHKHITDSVKFLGDVYLVDDCQISIIDKSPLKISIVPKYKPEIYASFQNDYNIVKTNPEYLSEVYKEIETSELFKRLNKNKNNKSLHKKIHNLMYVVNKDNPAYIVLAELIIAQRSLCFAPSSASLSYLNERQPLHSIFHHKLRPIVWGLISTGKM